MLVRRSPRAGVVLLALLAAGLWPGRGAAIEVGRILGDVKLRRLDGRPEAVVDRGASAGVLVFFRTGHERSVEVLGALRDGEGRFAGRAVRVVGIVSGGGAPEEVRATLAAAGSRMPVLVDEGDALYSTLSVRTLPAAVLLDRDRRVVAFEPYRPVRFAEVVVARVRRLLGEISEAELARELSPPESQLPGDVPLDVASRHVKLGRKLLLARAFGQAHENARRSLELAPSAAAWALEGEIFAAEGDCASARAAYESALRLDPADGAALAGRRACAPAP